MAELFRILIRRNARIGWWWHVGQDCFCSDMGLPQQVDVPGSLRRAELVAHNRPSLDRFACDVCKDEGGVYVIAHQVRRRGGGRRIDKWFWQPAILRMLKRHGLKAGDKFYVQIEY